MISEQLYYCRVCGLKQEESHWGKDGITPDYSICGCCGVEFGYEDYNINSIRKYRQNWIEKGAQWFSPKYRPTSWVLEDQLKNIPPLYR